MKDQRVYKRNLYLFLLLLVIIIRLISWEGKNEGLCRIFSVFKIGIILISMTCHLAEITHSFYQKDKKRHYAKPSCLDSNQNRIVYAAGEEIVLQTFTSLLSSFIVIQPWQRNMLVDAAKTR